ncbi:phage replisome organizer N-terminal domain-containing protein [Virgibacillus sp. CBA3643]|uniref:phage replisome organizer N-terminal domain-containing protein n=1 Tax=Virgibacillus sp. CBA3643 TaxID=2942278 RepID=UPI0035A2B192
MSKKYYWLKLKDDFFNQKEIKRLRRIAGGDTYTVIYLKLLLLSLKTEGKIYFDNVGDDFVDELSLEIDEDLDNIKVTLSFLQSKGLLEIVNESEYFMNEIPDMIGSEDKSAKRVRKHRERQKELQSNGKGVTCNDDVTKSNTEIEKDIDIEKDIEKDNIVEDKAPRSKYNFEQHHMKLAELLYKKIQENNPNAKKPNMKSWANTFRLMMERDSRTGEEIQELILWTQQHHFWYQNILSANALRKQYDRLSIQMQDDRKTSKGGLKHAVDKGSYEGNSTKYDFSKRRVM